jgi:hypothetical protein
MHYAAIRPDTHLNLVNFKTKESKELEVIEEKLLPEDRLRLNSHKKQKMKKFFSPMKMPN